MAYNFRDYHFRMSALADCYNETQVIPNCFDAPYCYNQTELVACYKSYDASYPASDATGYRHKQEKSYQISILYTCLLVYFMIECILRFISWPRFDPIYDIAIIIVDATCSFPVLTQSEDYLYFGIALPVRIGFLIADLDILRPTIYKLSLAVPRMLYIGMLFTTMMYFFGMSSFIIFSPGNNPTCPSCTKYFSDLQRSMVTMFQVSMFQNWGEVTDAMCAEAGFSDVFVISYFYTYGIVTTFCLFNVFYAMVTEIVIDWHGYPIPEDASTSFWNRVVLEFTFQLLEVFLTEEDRKKFEECENTTNYTSLKFKIFADSIKGYIRGFYETCFNPCAKDENQEADLLVNTAKETTSYSATEKADQLTELLLLVRSIDERLKKIENNI